jgi:hypothetical protein
VDQPTDEELDDARVVPVGTAPNEVVADMWRQVLEDEGIIATLMPTGIGPSIGTSALSQHVLLVREDQAELAREIIADLESDDSGAE